jgi:hypothetical protein
MNPAIVVRIAAYSAPAKIVTTIDRPESARQSPEASYLMTLDVFIAVREN